MYRHRLTDRQTDRHTHTHTHTRTHTYSLSNNTQTHKRRGWTTRSLPNFRKTSYNFATPACNPSPSSILYRHPVGFPPTYHVHTTHMIIYYSNDSNAHTRNTRGFIHCGRNALIICKPYMLHTDIHTYMTYS